MDNNAALIKLLESKRDYINSLENKFADEFGYGFGNYINDMHKDNPEYDFYDNVIDPIYTNDEPYTDFYGKPVTIDPNSKDIDTDIENYIYHFLLNTNPYD